MILSSLIEPFKHMMRTDIIMRRVHKIRRFSKSLLEESQISEISGAEIHADFHRAVSYRKSKFMDIGLYEKLPIELEVRNIHLTFCVSLLKPYICGEQNRQ